jgi:hypothetical protein
VSPDPLLAEIQAVVEHYPVFRIIDDTRSRPDDIHRVDGVRVAKVYLVVLNQSGSHCSGLPSMLCAPRQAGESYRTVPAWPLAGRRTVADIEVVVPYGSGGGPLFWLQPGQAAGCRLVATV